MREGRELEGGKRRLRPEGRPRDLEGWRDLGYVPVEMDLEG